MPEEREQSPDRCRKPHREAYFGRWRTQAEGSDRRGPDMAVAQEVAGSNPVGHPIRNPSRTRVSAIGRARVLTSCGAQIGLRAGHAEALTMAIHPLWG